MKKISALSVLLLAAIFVSAQTVTINKKGLLINDVPISKDWTLSEFSNVFSGLANIYLDGRRAQVQALNIQRFSEGEYDWVRRRVYEAAGVELAGSFDLSKVEELARDSAGKSGVTLPAVDLPKVSEKNIALVKPHAAKVREWIPMAVLGL